ncbi:MAG: hypothetical protein JNK16_14430 [Phycisphaerales bacterium]|nr:hypothetical protein [Phycisphaerales bacterium]
MKPILMALSTSLSFFFFAAAVEPPQDSATTRPPLPKITRTQNRNPDSSTVHCAAQDRAGNFWFGTTGIGAYGFWSITQDRSNTIWLGTRKNVLYRFGGKALISLSE